MGRVVRKIPVLVVVLAVLRLALIFSGCTFPPAAQQVCPTPPAATATVTYLPPAPGEMKTIGLIGGVGWSSSLEYYRIMNEKVQNELGGDHSAKLLMYSIEFGEFSKQERLAAAGNWDPLNATMLDAARRLKAGGADFIIIGSNTLNSRADDIEQQVGIPVLRIYDVTGAKVNRSGLKKVALLGTSFTMEQPFYRDALKNRYGIDVITPKQPNGPLSTRSFSMNWSGTISVTSPGKSMSGSSTGSRTRKEPRA